MVIFGERIPMDAVAFGADAIYELFAAFKGRSLLINLFYKLIFRFKYFAHSRIGGNVFLKGNLDEVNKLRTSPKLT